MKAGAIEFLTKPFEDDVLLDAIRGAIERSPIALREEAETQLLRSRYASLTPREREVMALSDFFASRDVDGDTFERHGWAPLQAQLSAMAASISSPRGQDHLDDNDDDDGPFGEEINDNDDDLTRVREVTYKYGIRAIAALYRHFDRTVRQPTLNVSIEYVKDSDDDADTFDDADFFGKVTVNGWLGQNRGEEALDTEVVINPGWAYGATVPLTGTVPVHIEIWDEDGESPLVPSASFGDDLIDIDPDDSNGDSTLDLQVDMAKCISQQPDAITGNATGACGQLLETEGDHRPLIEDSERAKVRFRIFVPDLPPVAADRPDQGAGRDHGVSG